MTVERAVATLASTHDDDLAATCAAIVQCHTIATFRSLPQIDRTAARVAETLGTDAYQAAHASGAALTYEEVAPTLLAELDRRLEDLREAEADARSGHTTAAEVM
jgi:ABC-type Fe3+-hydroxamate transport system substrate-binding protein